MKRAGEQCSQEEPISSPTALLGLQENSFIKSRSSNDLEDRHFIPYLQLLTGVGEDRLGEDTGLGERGVTRHLATSPEAHTGVHVSPGWSGH